jgi:DNA replication initiation complex subunit (GINS family)
METGQGNIIERLFASFQDLENAIEGAKVTLSKKETVPDDIIKRLGSYDGILAKQRTLATALCEHINTGNWDEVSRHVNLINGLSAMIRDDARAILSSISVESEEKAEEKTNYC